MEKLLMTGDKHLDRDHKKMVVYINRLYQLLDDKDTDYDKTTTLLSNVILHVREHFSYEEDVMRKFKYPHITEHKRQHEKILNEAQLAIISWREDNDSRYLQNNLREKIEYWFLDHIKEMDQPLMEYTLSQKK